MRAPPWLTARPVAHRGLHDAARGIIENMPAAAQAAIAGNFGIECDIQLTADGEARVHHDDALGRLTDGAGASGRVNTRFASERALNSSCWRTCRIPKRTTSAIRQARRLPLSTVET